MAYEEPSRQFSKTVAIICLLAAEPKLKADQIAKAVGVSTNYVARVIAAAKDAGVDIEYDFDTKRYIGKFAERFSKGLFGAVVSRLQKEITIDEEPEELKALRRWTIDDFAKNVYGSMPSNIYNMITGHKGQQLPKGVVAYQVKERGRWYITEMVEIDGHWDVPPAVKNYSYEYAHGANGRPTLLPETVECPVEELGKVCGGAVLSKGLCQRHYAAARRNPGKFRRYLNLAS